MISDDLTVEYNGTSMTGRLVWDDTQTAPRPGVLVIHEGSGFGQDAIDKAERIVREFGYVAYAMDEFGEVPADMEAILGWIGRLLADPKELRGRVNAALDGLAASPLVDRSRLAVIGYCFGGTSAIELARSGADVKAVVGFHAGLQGTSTTDAGQIKGKLLICNGAQDPFVTPDILQSFTSEMIDANIDWQMNLYGRARHSFTNVNAGGFGSDAYAYDGDADHRSWEAMRALFLEVLG
jgi:dienelactone hydrolase